MEEKINIDKILKDKPEKTILYDAMRDINVSLYVVEKRNGETNIFCDGMEKSDRKNLKKRLSICRMHLKSWRMNKKQFK